MMNQSLLGFLLFYLLDGFFFIRLVVNLGVIDDDDIGHGDGATLLSCGVIGQHDLDLDSHDSLLEEHMSNSRVDIIVLGLTSGDHVTLFELHALSSLLSELSRDDHFTTFTSFHDN
jgi:hypothetical protein